MLLIRFVLGACASAKVVILTNCAFSVMLFGVGRLKIAYPVIVFEVLSLAAMSALFAVFERILMDRIGRRFGEVKHSAALALLDNIFDAVVEVSDNLCCIQDASKLANLLFFFEGNGRPSC